MNEFDFLFLLGMCCVIPPYGFLKSINKNLGLIGRTVQLSGLIILILLVLQIKIQYEPF